MTISSSKSDGFATMQLCAKGWQLEQRCPVQGLALALANPRRLGLPRLGSTSPLIYVSSNSQEVSLWDIENARCHQVSSTQWTPLLVICPSSHQCS